MRPSDPDGGLDLVAFSPHPDDAELFCAGALLLAADAGRSTAVVDLTEGELATNGSPAQRRAERAAATDLLGLKRRVALRLPDGAVGTDPEHRTVVVDVLRELRPRLVLAPYWEDRHPDHGAAGRLLRDACFLAGLPKYATGAPHRPSRVYWYMLHHPFDPTVVLDITPVWERRRRLFEVYRSQVGPDPQATPSPLNDGVFLDLLDSRAASFGALVGTGKGEPYLVSGPLLVRSLIDLEHPDVTKRSRYRAYL